MRITSTVRRVSHADRRAGGGKADTTSMRTIDLVVLVWVLLAALTGLRRGMVAQLTALIGFGVGALIGSRVAPHLLSGQRPLAVGAGCRPGRRGGRRRRPPACCRPGRAGDPAAADDRPPGDARPGRRARHRRAGRARSRLAGRRRSARAATLPVAAQRHPALRRATAADAAGAAADAARRAQPVRQPAHPGRGRHREPSRTVCRSRWPGRRSASRPAAWSRSRAPPAASACRGRAGLSGPESSPPTPT